MDSTQVLESKENFLSFLMVYTSHVDFDFSQPEKELIAKHCENAMECIEFYDSLNDVQRVEILVDGVLKYLKEERNLEGTTDILQKLYKVDGVYCRFEKEFSSYLNLLVNSI